MDRTRNPRGQAIESLDDLHYWLDYIEQNVITNRKLSLKDQVLEKINIARHLTEYDQGNLQRIINEIDFLCNKDSVSTIERYYDEHNYFMEEAKEFQYINEKAYGEEAINTVLAELKKRVKQFDELPDTDEGKFILNRSLDYVRHDLEKGDYKTIWVQLYRIEFNLNENSNYFYRALDKKGLSKGGKPSPYRDHKKEITEIVKAVIDEKISKSDAMLDIGLLVRNPTEKNEDKVKFIKVETLNNYIKNYQERGDIFNKK